MKTWAATPDPTGWGSPMTETILGIDTSSRVCVGLARDGQPLASRAAGDSRSHVELLVPTLEALLDSADLGAAELTGVAIGMGPGPYTGLRAGVATAQMLAESWGLRLYQVCSLDVVGLGWALTNPPGDFVACSDARRKELYWGVYDRFGQRLQGPFVSPPADLPKLPCVGPGTLVHPRAGAGMDSFLAVKLGVRIDRFEPKWPDLAEVQDIVGIDAALMAAYAPALVDVGPEPLYLRHADTAPARPAKSVLAGRGRWS